MGGEHLSVADRRFYARPPLDVARDLLGARLCRGGVVVRLTEVEAYGGRDDPASHAFRGPTPRCAVMFGPPGHLYVYFVYGMHWCVNIVCGPAGAAAAVLLRAGEVVEGAADAVRGRAHLRRAELARGPGRLARALAVDGSLNGADLVLGVPGAPDPLDVSSDVPGPTGIPGVPEATGPGGGAGAAGGRATPFGLPGPSMPSMPSMGGGVLTGGALVACVGRRIDETRVARGPRIGIRAARDRPWRLWIAGDASVSCPRRDQRRLPVSASSQPLLAPSSQPAPPPPSASPSPSAGTAAPAGAERDSSLTRDRP
ncbi:MULTISPECIES: DNA-3-methyladenine glycosylase [Frankiaceae]|uniref:Putative 3-methyladenine DNA glycosylase n=1 Tax=Candidatus Protofrankia datiscae TaxID=2716812 RepID=F8AZT4_9ACTN|nr:MULTISPECIES: DNA-3-methyladenine glycosylase [Protofrankia]AEH10573.1 3-methyladenine DNA glycosylase [Candidatus Protofrankia datiscae]